jgi:peroxiredoxin
MRLAALGLVALVMLAGCASVSNEPRGGGLSGSDWRFVDIEGNEHNSTTTAGQPVLLFFMSTWCTSCQATAPRLATIFDEFSDRGLQMFTLSHDPSEDAADLSRWQERYDQRWPHAVDEASTMAIRLGVNIQSTVLVFDGEGAEVRRFSYARPTVEALRETVEAAFAA